MNQNESQYLRDLRAELVEAERPSWHPRRLLNRAIAVFAMAVLFASVWSCALFPLLGSDPVLDAQADLVCPAVCDECHGPYVHWWAPSYRAGRHRGGTLEISCQRAGGELATVPAGVFVLMVLLSPFALIPALVVLAIWWPFMDRADAERRANLRRRIAEAERMPPVG